MKRTFLFLLTLLALILTVSGCQLAVGDSTIEQMVGFYITTTSLEDYADENGRIYAEASGSGQETTYDFPGLDGVPFYEIPFGDGEDEAMLSDGSSAIQDRYLNFGITEEEETTSLEGTLYLSTELGQCILYRNPIYQDNEGNVYLIPEIGPSARMDLEGSTLSVTDSGTTTKTRNGKSIQQTFQILLHVTAQIPADQVVWCQMSADNREITRTAYAIDQVPETLRPETETEFLIVETYQQGELTNRSLVKKTDTAITTLQSQPSGWFDGIYTDILWE